MAQQWAKLFQAASLAAEWHAEQRRKGEAAEPYINHLLEVAELVAISLDEPSIDLLIAALLHDSIEDQKIPPEKIERLFGHTVAELVVEVSDDKSLAKEVRKQLQIDNARAKTHEAKILILADKTSNLSALARSPPSDWTPKRRLEYVQWSRRVVDGLRGTSAALEERFDLAARAAEQAWQVADDQGV